MNKILLALSTLLSISTLSVAAETSQKSAIEVLSSIPKWGLIQPGTSCIEHYQFLAAKEVKISSNQERVTGTYEYTQGASNFELPAMVIHFATDNLRPDCAGNSDNQAGTSTTNFLKIESDQKIYFCTDAVGKNCPVYLRPEN